MRVSRRATGDGLVVEELSWSVGYGPRTEAYFLRPAGAGGEPLPGVLALHDHGGFKFYGKEKIADGCSAPPEVLRPYRDHYYGGRAYANELARQGFVVLVPDTFCWGSRRFPAAAMPGFESLPGDPPGSPEHVAAYNQLAGQHEHLVSKYCTVLGASFAGVVAHEDRIALNYLRSRPEVDHGRVGALGLSGGGLRTTLLVGTADELSAAVVVGMMATYPSLLDEHVENHTWMLFPPGLPRLADWPDVAAARAPAPLLVQYDRQDELFSPAGMQQAHARLAGHYEAAGAPDAYEGRFYDGPHKFDLEMQADAFAWLARHLAP